MVSVFSGQVEDIPVTTNKTNEICLSQRDGKCN